MSADPRLLHDALLSAKGLATNVNDLVTNLQAYSDAVTPPPPPPPPPRLIITDRLTRPKPPPPALGPAGFTFPDPTFGTPILRVTDERTNGGLSCRVPSNELTSAWNVDSTKFYVLGPGGNVWAYDFDGTKATLIDRYVPGYIEPCFSYVNPNVLYIGGGSKGRTVQQFDFANGAVLTVLDLQATYGARYPLTGTYIGQMLFADRDVFVVGFGGGSQDSHYLLHHSKAGLFDAHTYATPFNIHASGIDRSGRFALIFPREADIPKVGQVLIWDTAIVGQPGVMKMDKLPEGHGSLGYGLYINQCDDGVGAYDGMQWQIRSLGAPANPHRVVPVKMQPPQKYIDDHTSWRNAQPNSFQPIISATIRRNPPEDPNLVPPRAWDDELLVISTDGSGTVRRLAHHQSLWNVGDDFWDQCLIQVSPNGKYVLFSSNWGRTIGAGRQDVFLAQL